MPETNDIFLYHYFMSLTRLRFFNKVLVYKLFWEVIMDKWKCSVCGYVYDPALGDPDGGIEPDTPFEKLPDDWVCPVCGAGKDLFEKEI